MASARQKRPAHFAPKPKRPGWVIGVLLIAVALIALGVIWRTRSTSGSGRIVSGTTTTTTTSSASTEEGTAPPIAENSGPPTEDSSSGPPVLVAVGDIVCSPSSDSYNDGQGTDTQCRAGATYALAASLNPDLVLAVGDLQYECGATDEFEAFSHSWGQFGSRLRPAIGNHEYGHLCGRDDASPYFSYFGATAGDDGHGWYSFNVGNWHVIALNSECSYGGGAVGGCNAGSAQEEWLKHDLATNSSACTIAYWHEPRFSSGEHGDNESMTDMWNDLVDAGVDVVLTGHNHDYERFDPLGRTVRIPGRQAISEEGNAVDIQDPVPDPNGIRNFVVGTGGRNLYPFTHAPLAGEVVRNDDTFGVLKLTLHDHSYDWEFVPVDGGGGFTDSGSAECV